MEHRAYRHDSKYDNHGLKERQGYMKYLLEAAGAVDNRSFIILVRNTGDRAEVDYTVIADCLPRSDNYQYSVPIVGFAVECDGFKSS